MGGFALCFALAAARREFFPEMVTRFHDLPTSGRVIRIPDGGKGVVCVAAEHPKLRVRSYANDDMSVAFDKYMTGRHFSIARDANSFTFCYKCHSTLNGHFLGSFKEFVWENETLYYVTADGDACGSAAYALRARFACDKTLHKGQFEVPSLVVSGDANCTVTTLIRSRYACRVPKLNIGANGVYNIKCIGADVYEKERAASDL